MQRINVGVIGLGEVAQIIHLPILEALSDRYRVAALCDISPTLLDAMANRYQIDQRYTFAKELTKQQDVDAVFVLNNDEYHAECVIAALKNGKHVLVEKPMCLTMREAEEIIAARDEAGVQVMVAYMRRFAPAFTAAVEEVRRLEGINYLRVHDIIGRNRIIIDQSSAVIRPNDIPPALVEDRGERAARLVHEAIGDVPQDLVTAYRFLLGLASHDISAMRELVGMPKSVTAASHWNGGKYLTAMLDFGDFSGVLEIGVDEQARFDAHIEVYGASKTVRVQYDSPYIRHLPTTLIVNETAGDACSERVLRPSYKDPYTHELEAFHDVVTKGVSPKTTPEDFMDDLRLFGMVIDALQADTARP